MPCDSVILNSVNLELADKDILASAIENMGGRMIGNRIMVPNGSFQLSGGKLTGDERTVGETADKIKQAYSRETVNRAARRYGWQQKQVGNKIVLTRRS